MFFFGGGGAFTGIQMQISTSSSSYLSLLFFSSSLFLYLHSSPLLFPQFFSHSPPFLSLTLCLEVSAKRASFSEKQKEWIDWVISCCSGGPFDQNWKAALHVRILLQQLFLSFTITTRHGHIQSFPFLSPHSLRVIACGKKRYYSSFRFLPPEHSMGRLC